MTEEDLLALRALHESIYDERQIPKRMRETLDLYAQQGVPPGSCTRAILANDLLEAFGRADIETTIAMPAIAAYVYNRMPRGCHGSYDAVDAWIEHCGLENRPRRRRVTADAPEELVNPKWWREQARAAMIAHDLSVEDVARETGLTVGEINALLGGDA